MSSGRSKDTSKQRQPSEHEEANDAVTDKQPIRLAQRFFVDFPVNRWTIDNFLSANADLVRQGDLEKLSRSWVYELKLLSQSARSKRQREEAKLLLTRYQNGNDKKIARESMKQIQKAQPVIVINGTGNSLEIENIAVNNSQVTTGPPLKRKRSGARKVSKSYTAPIFLKHYRKAYEAMTPERKWNLPSGVFAEDILYKAYKDREEEVVAHSWVINVHDNEVKALFSREDWEEICSKVPKPPALDMSLRQYLTDCASVEPAVLRMHLATTPSVSEEDLADSDVVYARTWVHDVLRAWSLLCENPSFWHRSHRENWYIANVWNPIFDRCMMTLRGAYMSRGESMSTSTSARKNPSAPQPRKTRSSRSSPPPESAPKRRRVGHLYDGVLQIHDDEVGAAEHGRTWGSSTSRKWARDSLKVTKVLHDMLRNMGPKARDTPAVGLVTAGWTCQLMLMGYADGYLCVVEPDDARKIPAPGQGTGELLLLCKKMWAYRCLLARSMGKNARTVGKLLDGDDAAEATVVPKVFVIPASVETDADFTDVTEVEGEWVDDIGEGAYEEVGSDGGDDDDE